MYRMKIANKNVKSSSIDLPLKLLIFILGEKGEKSGLKSNSNCIGINLT